MDKDNNKIYVTTAAKIADVDEQLDSNILKAYEAMSGTSLETQRDLMKLVAILLSTGMNGNDDVFLPEEVLPVRNTGAHKPLNMEHNSKNIIGHMLRTYVTLKDGTPVSDESNDVPQNFDITSESVIYKFVFPSIAKDIKEKALGNQLFVSVEVWFKDYDYLVGNKIFKRTQATANVLDDLLRINGGEGKYKGQKVGRVLRNMLIGGIGVVKNPANPESIIKNVSSLNEFDVYNDEEVLKSALIGELHADSSTKEICKMDENKVKEEKEEKLAIENYRKSLSDKEISTLVIASVDKIIELFNEEHVAVVEFIKSLSENKLVASSNSIAEMNKTIDLQVEELEILKANIKEEQKQNKIFKNKEEKQRRKESLCSLGFNDDTIIKLLEMYESLSPVEFDSKYSELEFIKNNFMKDSKIKDEQEIEDINDENINNDENEDNDNTKEDLNNIEETLLENSTPIDAPLDNKSDTEKSVEDRIFDILMKMTKRG